MRYQALLNRPEFFGAFVAFASITALAGALISQYGFGLYPCVLCLYQRVPYVIVAFLGVFAGLSPRFARSVLIICGVCFTVGAGIAFYHVGVEQGWWQSAVGCTFNSGDMSLEALRAQIAGAPRALCTDVAWSLFGVSMAGYNVIYSAGLAIISFFGAWKR